LQRGKTLATICTENKSLNVSKEKVSIHAGGTKLSAELDLIAVKRFYSRELQLSYAVDE
jgi:hypothetical protein